MPSLAPVSHDQLVADVRALAAALAADLAWAPTRLVGIGRGGLVPATYLSHATGTPAVSCDLSGGVIDDARTTLACLAARTRTGERLLFVDDINDTGNTIALVRAELAAAEAAAGAVRFATLIDNATSAEPIDYRARTIDRTVTKDWFVFPWEALAPTAAIEAEAAAVPERTA